MSDTIDPDRTVYVTSRSRTNGPVTIHLDRNCRCIRNADDVMDHNRSTYQDDVDICGWCDGNVDIPRNGSSGPWQMLQKIGEENAKDEAESEERPVWERQKAREGGLSD